jgi:hypothetical protein
VLSVIVNREEPVMDELSAGRVLGPLAPYAAGFVVELVGRGYRPRSVSGQLELMAHLSRWLAEEGVELSGLTVEMADRFLGVRRESASSLRSWRALDRCRDTSVRGGHLTTRSCDRRSS